MSTIFHAIGQAEALDAVSDLSPLGRAALEYADRGWHVFPCYPNSKEPIPKIGQNAATLDQERIRNWWLATPDANIGLHLAPSGLMAVDVDSYKGEASAPGELPPTLMQTSARGGRHAIYTADRDQRYGRNGAQNIDVKHRGYVLVEPSTFEGGTYRWDEPPAKATIAPAPQWTVRPKLDRTVLAENGRSLAEVEEALRHINPDVPYDEWLKVLMALHQGFGYQALTLAEDWTVRSTDPSHDHRFDQIEYKFASFTDNDPQGVTIAHIFHAAREHGADLAQLGEKHRQENLLSQFTAANPEELAKSIFEMVAEQEAEQEAADVFNILRIKDIRDRPAPTFLIGRHIPQGGLGFVVAAPGVGKTFLVLDMALTVAAGLPEWQGEPVIPSGDGTVLYIASEGSFDLPLRIKAWQDARGIEGDIDNFLILEAAVNFMDAESVSKLLRSLQQLNVNPAMVVVDTVSRALPGADENAQKDMTLFIAACERIQHIFGSAVVGLHHTAKSGGIRGSSVLEGAGDFIITLEREKGEDTGTLTMFKQKAGPDGWNYQFTLPKRKVDWDKPLPEGQNCWQSLTFEKFELHLPGDPAEQATMAAHEAQDAPPEQYPFKEVLQAMRIAWLDSKAWSKEPRAKSRYAVLIMQENFGIPKAIAQAALNRWLETGQVVSRITDNHSKRPGLYVVEEYKGMSEISKNCMSADDLF